MDLIVAVYDDWGIGLNGDQPIALSADRKFFRRHTAGSTVIVGRKTIDDFPGKQPLPGRINVAISRNVPEIPGFIVVKSVEEAAEFAAKSGQRAMVIGGGSIYRQMLPYCNKAIVTKVHTTVGCDTYFPNLDEDPAWEMKEIVLSGEENGIAYEMCIYERV